MALASGRAERTEEEEQGSATEPLRWLAGGLLLGMLALVGVWTVQRTTWYLAIDQFGYLTFAEDLANGHVHHRWPLLKALAPLLPSGELDVYSQTYVRRGDLLYCRYAPGFPLILAATRLALGPGAEHYVNPPILLLLLAFVFAIGRRVFGSAWLGLAAALLVALLPNYVLLWSTSPLRDVPAHMFALGGLLLLLPTPARRCPGLRTFAAGLLLGFSVTTRVDAVLYFLAAGALALRERAFFVRRLVLGALGVVIGVAPLLAYNAVSTGNPLRPTQAMELDSVLSRAPSLERWLATIRLPVAEAIAADAPAATPAPLANLNAALGPRVTPPPVQGGGLRLSNLGKTLPVNFLLLREALGDVLLILAAVGAVAALRRLDLFLLVLPYAVVAFVFFSLWTLPGPRYLTGVLLLLPLLAIEGGRTLAAAPAWIAARLGGGRVVGAAATIVIAGALAFVAIRSAPAPVSALPYVNWAVIAVVVLAAIVGWWGIERRRELTFALTLGAGLAAILIWRSTSTLGHYATFQRPQVERARTTIARVIDLPAVILTTTQIGRPAENINYYTEAEAVYLEEMARWQVQPRYALKRMLASGFAVYLLLTPDATEKWLENTNISTWYRAETVRTIAPQRADDYFVASPYHRGIPLVLSRLELKPGEL